MRDRAAERGEAEFQEGEEDFHGGVILFPGCLLNPRNVPRTAMEGPSSTRLALWHGRGNIQRNAIGRDASPECRLHQRQIDDIDLERQIGVG